VDSGSVSLQDLIRRRQAAGFVGRDGQLAQFAANFDLPAQDQRRRFVFYIHGDGGIGKTFLLGQLRRIATERGAVSAYVDEAVFSVPEAMARIAEQMAAQGHPMKNLLRMVETYRQRRSEVEADPQAPTGIASLMTRTATKSGVEALRAVPVAGEALADQTDQLRKFLDEKLRHEDVRMLLSPAEALTPTFVRELPAGKRARPLALFFDTYERTGPFLDDWLRALLEGKYGPLPANVVMTISGRPQLDATAWAPYLEVVADVPLVPLSDVEVRQMLNGRGIVDERVIEVILQLCGGLPLLVYMLAENKPEDATAVGDPSGDAVERFLRWEADPVRQRLAVTAALPRSVNEDVLHELVDEGADSHELFGWLRSLSFVTHTAGRCQYHEIVRSAMLRLERGQSPARWNKQHRRLAEFYRSLCTARSEKEAWEDESWRSFRLEEIYHALCGGSAGAVAEALSGLIYLLGVRANATRAWVRAIGQAGEDSGNAAIQQWGLRLAQPRAEAESEAEAIADLLLRHSALDAGTTAEAYRIRGRERRDQDRYDDALADFVRASELNPGDGLISAGRGETYRLMGRYKEALTDLTLALELGAGNSRVVTNRGEVYWSLNRRDEAMADFLHALEVDPNYAGISIH
jgi:tetratricopeptide (TPR) repeat protein